MQWMIYGANGYTGELIAREAVARGHRPLLAGRNLEKIAPLAGELGCEARAFDLASPDLGGVGLVLHCAGPFVRTSRPMIDACLTARAHYLDITGEISVFEATFARDAEAKERGITLLPGVGFDVVPTDCIAAALAARMPDANELWLAIYPRGGKLSRGTTKTMIEGIGEGGSIRRDGRIERVPLVFDVREIPFSSGPRLAMTIPWGDVATAFRTTGIPNIRVYNASSPRSVARMRTMQRLLPLVAWTPVRRLLQRFASRIAGPDDTIRRNARTYLWGRVSNGREEATMTLTTPEGYAFTAMSAVRAVERLAAGAARPGAWTPASLLGPDFVREIPGVE